MRAGTRSEYEGAAVAIRSQSVRVESRHLLPSIHGGPGRCLRGEPQQFLQLAVVPVDVIEEQNGTILLRQCGRVNNHDPNRGFETDAESLRAVHCCSDGLRSPGITGVAQYLGSESDGVADADAAMTESAA